MYNFRQSKWYGQELIELYSKANYNLNMPNFDFVQPAVLMPFVQ
jgi:hypothetical protein